MFDIQKDKILILDLGSQKVSNQIFFAKEHLWEIRCIDLISLLGL